MLRSEGTISNNLTEEYIVTKSPFFISNAKNGISIKDLDNTMCKILDKDKKILHPEILKLYEIISYDKEYQFKLYSFMSLNEIIKRKDNYTHFYDLALKYHGLGHILLISYYPPSEKFFFRMDGGSNGWDREAYYNKYKNYNPDICNISKEENPTNYKYKTLYTFEQMMSIISYEIDTDSLLS